MLSVTGLHTAGRPGSSRAVSRRPNSPVLMLGAASLLVAAAPLAEGGNVCLSVEQILALGSPWVRMLPPRRHRIMFSAAGAGGGAPHHAAGQPVQR